jgi:hypothetical protein
MAGWLTTLRRQGVGTRTAALAALVLVVWAVVATLAGLLAGAMALAAATVAAGLCLGGAIGALVAAYWLRDPRYMLHMVLVGMALRMGLPLATGLALHFRGGPLADAGVLYYLLVFYPVTLGIETFLSLPQTAAQPKTAPKTSQNLTP